MRLRMEFMEIRRRAGALLGGDIKIMKIAEYNAQLRAKGIKVTQGFEFSRLAFYCPTHGFCEEVISKPATRDMYGFGMDYVEVCPECGMECEAKQQTQG